MSNDGSSFKDQLNKILKIDNEEVNPFGKPFRDLRPEEKEVVIKELDAVPERNLRRSNAEARTRRAREKKKQGRHSVILLGKFNAKTEELMKEKCKELGYKYPASLINDAMEDFLGMERGSSIPDSMKGIK